MSSLSHSRNCRDTQPTFHAESFREISGPGPSAGSAGLPILSIAAWLSHLIRAKTGTSLGLSICNSHDGYSCLGLLEDTSVVLFDASMLYTQATSIKNCAGEGALRFDGNNSKHVAMCLRLFLRFGSI